MRVLILLMFCFVCKYTTGQTTELSRKNEAPSLVEKDVDKYSFWRDEVTDRVSVYDPFVDKYVVIKEILTVKDFGATDDELGTDDTQAFRDYIAYCKVNNKDIIIDEGVYYLTDTLLIDFRTRIIGQGKENTKVIFDLTSAKNAITFSNVGGNSTIKDVAFSQRNFNSPSNLNGLAFEDNLNDLTFQDVEIFGFTGYAIYFQKEGTYGGNAVFNNVSFKRVGGCIGQDTLKNIGRWWFNIVKVTNMRLDNFSGHSINNTSPQKYTYDFQGWRSLNIDNILAQGAIQEPFDSTQIESVIRVGGGNSNDINDVDYWGSSSVNISGVWTEYNSEHAEYSVLTEEGISAINIKNAKLWKVKVNGDAYSVNISDFRYKTLAFDKFVDVEGNASITFDNVTSNSLNARFLNSNNDYDLTVKKLNIFDGRLPTKDDEPERGVSLNWKRGAVVSEQKGIINYDRFIIDNEVPEQIYYTDFDTDEGRIFCTSLGGNQATVMPQFPFEIKVTDENVGKYHVLSFRFKVVTTDNDSRFRYTLNSLSNNYKYSVGCETYAYAGITGQDGTGVNNPKGQWKSAYMVARPTSAGMLQVQQTNQINIDVLHTLQFSAIKLKIGNEVEDVFNNVSATNNIEIVRDNLDGYEVVKGDKLNISGNRSVVNSSGIIASNPWTVSTVYAVNQVIYNSSNEVYRAENTGTSLAEPTGVNDVNTGNINWLYLGIASN